MTTQAQTPTEVATRMAPQFALIRVGAVSAVLAVATAVVAVVSYPADAGTDLWFPIGFGIAALVLVGICVAQLMIWRRALAAWRADRTYEGDRSVVLSSRLHWISYPVLLAALYLSIEASALGGFSDLPGFVLGIGALLVIVAQVTAAVQYLRTEGGPGTIPNHLRTVLARVQAQR